jgi:hypothetical protein
MAAPGVQLGTFNLQGYNFPEQQPGTMDSNTDVGLICLAGIEQELSTNNERLLANQGHFLSLEGLPCLVDQGA